MTQGKIINIGIIGVGEVSQVVHIPTFGYLSDKFKITYLSDSSENALEFAMKRVNGFSSGDVKTTQDSLELISSKDVDIVLIATPDEYHVPLAIEALKRDKFVLVEKPVALTDYQATCLLEAEKESKGKVFIGYMRRYAPAFDLAIEEIRGIKNIKFARARDIIGPNVNFVNESGTFPKSFNDYSQESVDDKNERGQLLVTEALERDIGLKEYDQAEKRGWRLLGGLGSHDISLLREALGSPIGYIGAKVNPPFVNALLDYGDFAVSYETGIHQVSEFDAHLEVYGENKIVKVQYNTPYVKGLPITFEVRENIGGQFVTKVIRPTFEDPYTIQANKLYRVFTQGEDFKTTANDAVLDLEIFKGIIKASNDYKFK